MDLSHTAPGHPPAAPRRRLSRGWRNTLLTAHIIVSVGLLGDSAGFFAVALRANNSGDAGTMLASVEVLKMFAMLFGIPLSFAALFSGIALGLGTKWGVVRHPWVVTKLLLIISVMVVGGVFIGPALTATLEHGENATGRLVFAAAYDVVALGVAVGLSVFKPGRSFRSRAAA